MSLIVFLSGLSNTGKSTSLANLNPKDTVFVSADKKPFPKKGFKKEWNTASKNYFEMDDLPSITSLLVNVSEHAKHVKVFVLDTLTASAESYLFSQRAAKGFDKYSTYANQVLEFVDVASKLREDLQVVIVAHTTTVPFIDSDGEERMRTQIAFSGNALNKTGINKYIAFHLSSDVVRDHETGEVTYQIRSKSNGLDEVRSIPDVLDDYEPADMRIVLDKIRKEYME